MSFGISLHVWGDYACFTRPELKAERMSYDAMTPSAARGILTAIYWKPQMRWVIDRIHVISPIRFAQVRRNEVDRKMLPPDRTVLQGKKKTDVGLYIEDCRQQRVSTILRDVDYVIDAHIEIKEEEKEVNSIAKHLEIFKRRARKGQCFHQPYFGTREFPVAFELVETKSDMPKSKLSSDQYNCNLGLMLHDMVYDEDQSGKFICSHTNKKYSVNPRFFFAVIQDGVIHVPDVRKTLS